MKKDNKVIEKIIKKIYEFTKEINFSTEENEKTFTAQIIDLIKNEISFIEQHIFIKKIILLCIFPLFHSSYFHVRTEHFKIVRVLFTSPQWWIEMMNLRLDLVFTRSLDILNKNHQERLQVFGIVGKAFKLCPEMIPLSIIKCLCQSCYDAAELEDRYADTYLGLVINIVLSYPNVTKHINIFKPLIHHNYYKKNVILIYDSIMLTILSIYDNPQYRTVELDNYIKSLLSPYIDDTYQHSTKVTDNCNLDYLYWYWSSTKNAIRAALTTWAGFLCLFKDDSGFKSLLTVLPHSKPEAQTFILSLLGDIFSIELPDSHDQLSAALATINPLSSLSNNWSFNNDYIIAEVLYILKPRGNGINIINIYQAFLLQACISCNIIKLLIQTIVLTPSEYIKNYCIVLLGELFYRYYKLLPASSRHDNYLCEFFTKNKDFFNSSDYCSIAKTVFRLEQYNKWKLNHSIYSDCSLFTLFLLYDSKVLTNSLEFYKIDSRLTLINRSEMAKNKETADIIKLIDESKVCKESSYDSWNWEKIIIIFTHYPILVINKSSEHLNNKFLLKLIQFFTPHRLTFFNIDSTLPYAKKITNTAILLFKSLLHPSQPNEALQWLHDFLLSLSNILKNNINVNNEIKIIENKNIVNNPITFHELCNSMNNCLSREYFHIIGQIQRNVMGRAVIDNSIILQNLYLLLNTDFPLSFIKAVIPALYYEGHTMSRKIFTKAIHSSSDSIRLYCTKFLRVLLRSNTLTFSSWAIEFLATSVNDSNSEIVEEALDIIEESIDSDFNLAVQIAKMNINYLALGETAIRVLTRILCILPEDIRVQLNIEYLCRNVCTIWYKDYCDIYYKWFEKKLFDAFSNFDNSSIEKNAICFKKQKKIYNFILVPISLERIFKDLSNYPELLKIDDCNEVKSVRTINRNILFIANYCSTIEGLNEIIRINPNILIQLIKVSTKYPFLSTRWIAIIALNIICKSKKGAELLDNLGWKNFNENITQFSLTPEKYSAKSSINTKISSRDNSIKSLNEDNSLSIENKNARINNNSNPIPPAIPKRIQKSISVSVGEDEFNFKELDRLEIERSVDRRIKTASVQFEDPYNKLSSKNTSAALGFGSSKDSKMSFISDNAIDDDISMIQEIEPISRKDSGNEKYVDSSVTICLPENIQNILHVNLMSEKNELKNVSSGNKILSLTTFGKDSQNLVTELSQKCIICSYFDHLTNNESQEFKLIECKKFPNSKQNLNQKFQREFEPKSDININLDNLNPSNENDAAVIREEIIRIFFNFISPSLSKSAQRSITQLKLRFSDIFRDYCLYKHILDKICNYNVYPSIRRYLHLAFNNIDLKPFIYVANIAIKQYNKNNDDIIDVLV